MRDLSHLLWCDLESDAERLEFIDSGRAADTGIIAPSMAGDITGLILDRQYLIDALYSMFSQYCRVRDTTADGRPMYDHDCMTAGENASDLLVRFGKITEDQLAR